LHVVHNTKKSLVPYHCSGRSCSNEDKTDDVKNSFYEELERVFDKFPKCKTKILLDSDAEIRKENIFKPTIGSENLHKIKNDNGVRVVKVARSKISQSIIQCSHVLTFINLIHHLMMEKPQPNLPYFFR
jgi:hypothetical protein